MWAALTMDELNAHVNSRATVVYCRASDSTWTSKPGPPVVTIVTTGRKTTVAVPGSPLYDGELTWFRHHPRHRAAYLVAVSDAVNVAALLKSKAVNVLPNHDVIWGPAGVVPAGFDGNPDRLATVDSGLLSWPWSERLAAMIVNTTINPSRRKDTIATVAKETIAPSFKALILALLPAKAVVNTGKVSIALIKPVWTPALSKVISKAISWHVVLKLPHRIDILDPERIDWIAIAKAKVTDALNRLPIMLPPALQSKAAQIGPTAKSFGADVDHIIDFCVRMGVQCTGPKAVERAQHMAAVIKRQLRNGRPFMGPACLDQRRDTGQGALRCPLKRTPIALQNGCGVADPKCTPSDVITYNALNGKKAPPCFRHGNATANYQNRFEAGVALTIAYVACAEHTARSLQPQAKRSRTQPHCSA